MKICVIGVTGRVGNILKNLIEASSDKKFSGGISSSSSIAQIENIIKDSDIVIDFSIPKASLITAEIASDIGVPFLCGTTGFSAQDFNILKSYSDRIAMMYASNFSIGVQLMAVLVKKCSETLHEFDVSIMDIHHKNKKDSPSGTALFLASKVKDDVQISSIRAGNIFGQHKVNFIGDDESISIEHTSFNRSIFAKGALYCSDWLMKQKIGFYKMEDCLMDIVNAG